jgi:hypothetical protein
MLACKNSPDASPLGATMHRLTSAVVKRHLIIVRVATGHVGIRMPYALVSLPNYI